jgi:hypothetical protein
LNRSCFEVVLKKNTPRTLGVKDRENQTWQWILDAIGCCFALLRRVS